MRVLPLWLAGVHAHCGSMGYRCLLTPVTVIVDFNLAYTYSVYRSDPVLSYYCLRAEPKP